MRRKHEHHGELRALAVGDHLPDIELVDHNGLPWHTAPAQGRSLVLILHRHLG